MRRQLLLKEAHNVFAKLVSTTRATLLGDESREPLAIEHRLGLVERGTGKPERRGTLTDGLPVNAYAPHHFILHLDEVAAVEKVGRSKERVGNVLWMRIEAPLLAERSTLS